MTSARNTIVRSPAGRPTVATFGWLLMAIGALALFGQAAFVGVHWWRERVPDYQVGDRPDSSWVTPVDLAVVDPEATAREREQEGRRLPPLVRFDSRIGNRAVENFIAEFDRRQALFEDGLHRHWSGILTTDEVASQTFLDYVSAFRLAHPDFPLSDDLALSWAGESAPDRLRNETVAAIRQTLSQYVMADGLPREEQGYSEVFLSAPVEAGGVRTADQMEARAGRLATRSLLNIDQARAQLQRELLAYGDDWAAYVGKFLLANVTFDDSTTREVRTAYARSIEVRVEFHAGEPVITAAQSVTEVGRRALAALRERHARLDGNRKVWQQWPALVGGALIVLGLILYLASRRSGDPLLPECDAVMAPSVMANPLKGEALRRGLMRHLAGWLKQAFVQRLIQQRNEAVATQAEVSHQVERLNERLTRLDPEIRERVAQYERRIAQLERELKGANEVSRELISTKIAMARKELEIEKARSNLVWN